MDWTILWWVLAVLIIIAGLAGTVVPALPGVPLVFLGLFDRRLDRQFRNRRLDHHRHSRSTGDYRLGRRLPGRRRRHPVPRGKLASVLGRDHRSNCRHFLWYRAGMLLGPFIGAVLGELSGGSNVVQSGRAGIGAWLGMVLATAVKLAIAFLMIGIFIFQPGFLRPL